MFDTLTRMGASAAGAYEIERSLRFDRPSGGYFSRTPSSAGNRRTFTLSCWVKPFGDGRFIEAGSSHGTNGTGIFWGDLQAGFIYDVGATYFTVKTASKLRDTSSWYHIVWQIDTTQGAGADRVKIFVNGVAQSMVYTASSGTHIPQNTDLHINNTISNSFGRRTHQNDEYLQANVAEVHFLDGTITAPTAWAETDATTGQWIPKEYTGGNYGTNGFYLDFSDNSDTTSSTLGKDRSGNDNDWTPSNFSVAAGVGCDSLIDTPTNNYCNFNSNAKVHTGNVTLSNGNLDVACGSTSGGGGVMASHVVSSGKWYWEVTISATSSAAVHIGVLDEQATPYSNVPRYDPGLTSQSYSYQNNATKYNNNSNVSYGATYTNGDVIGVKLDLDNGTLEFLKNNTSQGQAYSGLSGGFAPAIGDGSSAGTHTVAANFGQRAFAYSIPAGYKEICSANLPTPTIKDGTKYFNTVLYEGTGSKIDYVSVGFQPDLTWIKNRDDTDDQVIQDSERGDKVFTGINDNDVEGDTGGGWVVEVADGFTIDANGQANTNNESFVAWCWKEGASNGFTMSTFTPGSGASTYSHSLGVKPDLIIVKCRTEAAAWDVYHSATTADYKLYFSDSAAKLDSGFMNDTEPTSSVFTFDPGNQNGDVHIAYCFTSVAGFLKVGSYTGSGDADGPFVYTGFKVAYLLVKNADRGANWTVYDIKRDPTNEITAILEPNINNAEESGHAFEFNSNGFKVRNNNSSFNHTGETMVYMAIAETPFKYANAR